MRVGKIEQSNCVQSLRVFS